MNNKGSVAAMAAVLAVPLVLSLGVAVDLSSLWVLQQRMQWAVDAAALLGASQSNGETAALVTKDAKELFWLSYGAPLTSYLSGTQVGFLGSSSAGATVTTATAASGNIPANPYVTVTASATLPTFLMGLVGQNQTSVTVSSTAAVPHRVEMAVVLDNSVSMGFPTDSSNTTLKLAALQTAAQNLVSTIFGSSASASPNVSMAIVPFAGAVNVGNDAVAQSFLKSGTLNAKYSNDTTSSLGWRGCVQARAYVPPATSYDTTEDDPSSDTTKFDPYFYPSTINAKCKTNNGNGKCTGAFYTGDNDFPVDGQGRATSVNDTTAAAQTGNTNLNYFPFYFNTSQLYYGPNLFCPRTSLVKLTSNTTTLYNTINSMALVNGGGTVIDQGMQWGWFTVSPLWTEWQLPASPTGAARPVAYTDTGTTKIVVLMTDGVNEVDGIDSTYGAASDRSSTNCNQINNVYPECFQVDSWYTSYQRVSSGVLTTSGGTSDLRRQNAATELRTRLQTLCQNMKNKGILIYTIFFHGYYDDAYLGALTNGAGPDLQSCASDANHYFSSQSASAINAAFQQIAQDINDLRIAK